MRATDRRAAPFRRPRSAFTLLELVVVIAIAGLLAGVAIPSLARLVAGGDPGRTLEDLRGQLASARAVALREARTIEARVVADEAALSVEFDGRRRVLPARWLSADPPEPRRVQAVRFGPMGLADRKDLEFHERTDGPATIWRLPIDPVSGAIGVPHFVRGSTP